MNEQPIKPGIWRHYKGGIYEVLFCATHTETGEELVVYQALYGKHKCFCRPASMWEEVIQPPTDFPFEDGEQRRFTYICKSKSCLTCWWMGRGEEINDHGHCWKHNGEPDFDQPPLEEGCDGWESAFDAEARKTQS